ncbi:uncharacterized protein ZBIST_3291 [Zygosaccharomyces bailii]|nr:uncharacterized protein ZBIST_3291 [Zygosaccharomyces bailii]
MQIAQIASVVPFVCLFIVFWVAQSQSHCDVKIRVATKSSMRIS